MDWVEQNVMVVKYNKQHEYNLFRILYDLYQDHHRFVPKI